MAIDIMQVADAIIAELHRRLGEEIELIFLYGSRVKGTLHRYSDLDFCYVPAQETTTMHLTVMVDDVLFDLFPLQWSKLTRMANYDNISLSLILDARIVYAQSADAVARFQALQQQIQQLQQPASRSQMLAKARDIFRGVGFPYYQLRMAALRGDLPSGKVHAQRIIDIATHALVVTCQTAIDTRKFADIRSLPAIPEVLPALLDGIARSGDAQAILEQCESLLQVMEALLREDLPTASVSWADAFDGIYPEYRAHVLKLISAGEQGDWFQANTLVVYLLEEFETTFASLTTSGTALLGDGTTTRWQHLTDLGFPNLLPSVMTRDLPALTRQCLAFDRHFQELLVEHGVGLYMFASLQELYDRGVLARDY